MGLEDGSEQRAVNPRDPEVSRPPDSTAAAPVWTPLSPVWTPAPPVWTPTPPDRTSAPTPDRTDTLRLLFSSTFGLWRSVKEEVCVLSSKLAASFLGLFSTVARGISPADEQFVEGSCRQKRSLFHCWFQFLVFFCLLVFFWCYALSYSSLSLWRNFPLHKRWFFNQTCKDKEPSYRDKTTEPSYIHYHLAYPRNYQFIMDKTDVCKNRKPFLVLMVPVAPQNVAARDAIRQTWGKDSTVQGEEVLTLFMLGLSKGDDVEKLKQEDQQHHDLIQSNFMDTYLNLTIKTMVIMDWLTTRCPTAAYAMKVDSDMFLNIENLVLMLQKPGMPKLNYLTGMLMHNVEVIRSKDSKWYVSEELYPDPLYPTYTLGMGYIFSNDLPLKFVEASKSIKPFNIEDAYIGMCMKKLGLSPTSPPNPSQFKAYSSGYNRCEYSKIITYILGSSEQLKNYWANYKKPGPHC